MISRSVVQCLDRFTEILSAGHLEQHEAEVPYSLWQDELGRFRVWVSDTGAHQTNQSSLDYRLRDASHIRDQVIRLLNQLLNLLDDLQTAPDEALLEISDSESDISSDESLPSETRLIYQRLVGCISGLNQTSILIRRPAPCDRLVATMEEDTTHFTSYCCEYTRSKYPRADAVVVDRLNRMVSNCQALQRYREKHRPDLSPGLDTDLSRQFGTAATDSDCQDGTNSESDQSIISPYVHGDRGIPPPPEESANRRPFRCPYCFYTISIRDRRAWKQHVLSDLMPYVCIFPACETPGKTYDRRQDWFSHLVQMHHLTAGADSNHPCPLCHEPLPQEDDAEKHLGRHLEELALLALPCVNHTWEALDEGEEEQLPEKTVSLDK